MHRVDHTESIIEVRGVSFSYGGDDVLRDVNLDIHRGDYLAIVGGNGAGKTTLLKIMLGLLSPRQGSVRLFGTDLSDFKEREKIGYVPQKALSFDSSFPATALEVVLMGRYAKRGLLHAATDEDRYKALEALDRVGAREYKDKLVGDLSGGEQQRVFIARALAADPEVIFLDEPTTAIDADARDDFYALLKKLNEELDITLVLITHDVERVVKEAMHIACVERTLVFHESPEAYLAENGPITDHHHA